MAVVFQGIELASRWQPGQLATHKRYTCRWNGYWNFLGQIITLLVLDVVRIGYREDNELGRTLRDVFVFLTHNRGDLLIPHEDESFPQSKTLLARPEAHDRDSIQSGLDLLIESSMLLVFSVRSM